MANTDPSAQSRDPLLGIKDIINEIFEIKDRVLSEKVDQAAARKAAQERKRSKLKSRARAEKERGKQFDAEKADKADSTKPKRTDTSAFKNDTSFHPTHDDAHLHTDGKCDDTSLRRRKDSKDYARVGDTGKNPCDKKYPKFDRERIAGSLRQAYERGDSHVISQVMAAARSAGMHPTGHLWHDRPECKQYHKTGVLPKGFTAKMCKPHGQGGADEWARKHKSKAPEHEKHKAEPSARRKGFYGHRRGVKSLPKDASAYEKSYYAAGGRHGELKRGAERTLSRSEIEKRAGGKSADTRDTNVAKARWHRLTKDTTGKKSA